MNTRLFVALLVATACAVPAIAQDRQAAVPEAAEDAAAAAAPKGRDETVPASVEPDPLTPPPAGSAPVAAPGAPAKAPPAADPTAQPDPIIAAVRTALAAWPQARDQVERAHVEALRTHYSAADATPVWTSSKGATDRAIAVAGALQRADDWGLEATAYNVPAAPASSAAPAALADAEIRMGLAVLAYARHARGGRIDPPALSAMIDMRPRLYEPASVLAAIASAPAADSYLEGLHPR
ncbi:MAG: hypothetical protein SFW09_18650, partial [Hyphomicrobiaceae bacterium]|nr:hypothetical protein [Hyphomicrobiaceae bacterium]